MTRWDVLFGALALALVLVGTRATGTNEAGAQFATPAAEAGTGEVSSGTTTEVEAVDGSDATAPYEAFLTKFAANLGLGDPRQVDAAIRTALTERIDAADAPLRFGVPWGGWDDVGLGGPFAGHDHGHRGGDGHDRGPWSVPGGEWGLPSLPAEPGDAAEPDAPAVDPMPIL